MFERNISVRSHSQADNLKSDSDDRVVRIVAGEGSWTRQLEFRREQGFGRSSMLVQ